VPYFVNQDSRDWLAEATERQRAEGVEDDSPEEEAFLARHRVERPEPRATLEDVVAHVEHVREVAGIDHVGLGGDYDGVGSLPQGLEDVTGYPRLLEALAERGWSSDDLARLTCRNVLRTMADAGLTDRGESREPESQRA
jgi:membrane dipeptidase